MAPRKPASKTTENKPEPMPAVEAQAAPAPVARPGRKAAAKPAPEPEKPAKAAARKTVKTLPVPPVPAEDAVKPAKEPAAGKPARTRTAKKQPAPEVEAEIEAAPAAQEPAPPAAPAEAVVLSDQAQAVLQAIRDGRAVELLFADPDANPPRTFEPRQLIYDTFAQGWYIWGWDRRYNAERHHLLSLVAQVNLVEGMGRAAQGPYKEGTPANQIGGWLGGEPIHVKAVLLKQWIFAVRQAPAPFPEFAIEDLEEGKAQITFTATDLRAITRWAMQFGDGIQVLEPQRLLDRIKQVGLAWGGKPAQPAPAPAPAPKAPPAPRAQAPRPATQRQTERQSEHRSERQSEHRSERQAEHRPEHRSEAAQERKSHESAKPSKPAKFEIRIDRL